MAQHSSFCRTPWWDNSGFNGRCNITFKLTCLQVRVFLKGYFQSCKRHLHLNDLSCRYLKNFIEIIQRTCVFCVVLINKTRVFFDAQLPRPVVEKKKQPVMARFVGNSQQLVELVE